MNVMQSSMINGANDLKAGVEKTSQKGLMVPSTQVEQGTKPSVTTYNAQTAPALLLELVTIVTQLAQLDTMSDNVKKSAPDAGSEAVKWHQVSVQALETSRKYLVEQQTSLIQRLANATGQALPAQSGIVALEPKEHTPVAEVPVVPPPGMKERTPVAEVPVAPPPGLEMLVHNDENSRSAMLGEGNSLRTDLEKIKLHEPGTALLVRKIKPFGFESAEYLRTYFEQFGEVAEVLVSHCITKPSPKRGSGRVRPAALGFVVMASANDAEKAFAKGEQHAISYKDTSVDVQVKRFREGSEFSEDKL